MHHIYREKNRNDCYWLIGKKEIGVFANLYFATVHYKLQQAMPISFVYKTLNTFSTQQCLFPEEKVYHKIKNRTRVQEEDKTNVILNYNFILRHPHNILCGGRKRLQSPGRDE
jgi:hypothetical protein